MNAQISHVKTCKKSTNTTAQNMAVSIIESFKFIQSKGMDEFLKAEKEKWRCPTCGGVICVHTKRCYTCNP